MELTFSEAAKGANKELNINIDDTCPRCDGSGSEPGTKVSHCNYCNGTGMVSLTSCSRSKQLPARVQLPPTQKMYYVHHGGQTVARGPNLAHALLVLWPVNQDRTLIEGCYCYYDFIWLFKK